MFQMYSEFHNSGIYWVEGRLDLALVRILVSRSPFLETPVRVHTEPTHLQHFQGSIYSHKNLLSVFCLLLWLMLQQVHIEIFYNYYNILLFLHYIAGRVL